MAGANESRVHCWLAAEHARLHIVAERPDSPGKQALVNAIWSSIQPGRLSSVSHATIAAGSMTRVKSADKHSLAVRPQLCRSLWV